MNVKDAMTRDVRLVKQDDPIEQAASIMAECDIGCVPVQDGDRLVGMVTDRDIAVRAAALGKNPHTTKVREIMSAEIKYCFEDEDLNHVADNMGELQIRRLPVMNREKRLVGIIALGDIATKSAAPKAGEALESICQHDGAAR